MDFITGDRFMGLADFTYSPQVKIKGDYNHLPDTLKLSKLRDGSIIYTHTFYAKQLFEVIKNTPKKVVVITHNGDTNIDETFILPDNVIKWYSQNVNVVNERIESIPIGIENDRWLKHVNKKRLMEEKLKEKKDYKNLAYMNFSIKTNSIKRKPVYEYLKSKPYITVRMGENGYYFDHYLDSIYNHKYVICPEGNGLDTHRFWETLYMNSVPIVEKNTSNWFYNDMPVLYVNKWEEVTADLLIDMWEVYKDGDRDGGREKLTFEYWKNKIKNVS
jgi:hypothetical protein